MRGDKVAVASRQLRSLPNLLLLSLAVFLVAHPLSNVKPLSRGVSSRLRGGSRARVVKKKKKQKLDVGKESSYDPTTTAGWMGGAADASSGGGEPIPNTYFGPDAMRILKDKSKWKPKKIDLDMAFGMDISHLIGIEELSEDNAMKMLTDDIHPGATSRHMRQYDNNNKVHYTGFSLHVKQNLSRPEGVPNSLVLEYINEGGEVIGMNNSVSSRRQQQQQSAIISKNKAYGTSSTTNNDVYGRVGDSHHQETTTTTTTANTDKNILVPDIHTLADDGVEVLTVTREGGEKGEGGRKESDGEEEKDDGDNDDDDVDDEEDDNGHQKEEQKIKKRLRDEFSTEEKDDEDYDSSTDDNLNDDNSENGGVGRGESDEYTTPQKKREKEDKTTTTTTSKKRKAQYHYCCANEEELSQYDSLGTTESRESRRHHANDDDDDDDDDDEDSSDDDHDDKERNDNNDNNPWVQIGLKAKIATTLTNTLGFNHPTQIQKQCIPPAIAGKDVLGAAQTGSGKTLAFGLPLLHNLMMKKKKDIQEDANSENRIDGRGGRKHGLKALILAPTRELALQVAQHLQKVAKEIPNSPIIHPFVGGISQQKQDRFLRKRPEIIVATPGRLWELMTKEDDHSNNNNTTTTTSSSSSSSSARNRRNGGSSSTNAAYLRDLSQVESIVIDEADRMLKEGQFAEMTRLLVALFDRQTIGTKLRKIASRGGGYDEFERRIRKKNGRKGSTNSKVKRSTDKDNDLDESLRQFRKNTIPRRDSIQISVFSATLTLPQSLRERTDRNKGGHTGTSNLEDIIDLLPFSKRPFISDLTPSIYLPDGIREYRLKCEDEFHRDAQIYALLLKGGGREGGKNSSSTVVARQKGDDDDDHNRGEMKRTIIFVNAISSAKRLGAILKHLLPDRAFVLHARQQQRQRLKALDRFRKTENGILIATDVAARGLDIPAVSHVIHYQLPASGEMYIHRSGRTARMYEHGTVISVVLDGDRRQYKKLRIEQLRAQGEEGKDDSEEEEEERQQQQKKKKKKKNKHMMRGLSRKSSGPPLPPYLRLQPRVEVGAMRVWKLAAQLDLLDHRIRKRAADKATTASIRRQAGLSRESDDSDEKENKEVDLEKKAETILASAKARGRNRLNNEDANFVAKVLAREAGGEGKETVDDNERKERKILHAKLQNMLKNPLESVGEQTKRRPILNTVVQRELRKRAKRERRKHSRQQQQKMRK